MQRKQEQTVCDNCGITFLKSESELKRNKEKGRRNYCSRRCVGEHNHRHLEDYVEISKKNLKKGSECDEYSGLRDFVRRAKNRSKEVTITKEYLKEIWDKQEGKCAYSKVQLILPKYNVKSNPMYTASLDRFDSSKGYIEGNVQFVSIAINTMKGEMSHEDTLTLIKLIKES